jgi:hypothetical protein
MNNSEWERNDRGEIKNMDTRKMVKLYLYAIKNLLILCRLLECESLYMATSSHYYVKMR